MSSRNNLSTLLHNHTVRCVSLLLVSGAIAISLLADIARSQTKEDCNKKNVTTNQTACFANPRQCTPTGSCGWWDSCVFGFPPPTVFEHMTNMAAEPRSCIEDEGDCDDDCFLMQTNCYQLRACYWDIIEGCKAGVNCGLPTGAILAYKRNCTPQGCFDE